MLATSRARGATLLLLVLVGLALVASTPAAAQDPTQGAQTRTQLSATPPGEPVRPLSGLQNVDLSVTYTYQEGGASFVTTPIELQVTESPGWITAIVTPSTVYVPVEDGQGGSTTVTTTVVVQTTSEAPAFQQGNIEIEGQARQNGDMAPSSGTTTIPIQAGFYSVIDARTNKSIVVAGPQEQIDFPVEVTNFGNGDQTISLEQSEKSGGLDVVLPGTITVSSTATGGQDNARELPVSVQTAYENGYINRPGTFNLDVTSAYALDQSNGGMSTRVSALVTTQGFFVPGPGTLLTALAGVAAAGGALRLRRGGRD